MSHCDRCDAELVGRVRVVDGERLCRPCEVAVLSAPHAFRSERRDLASGMVRRPSRSVVVVVASIAVVLFGVVIALVVLGLRERANDDGGRPVERDSTSMQVPGPTTSGGATGAAP